MVVKVLLTGNREHEEVAKIIKAGGDPNIVDYFGVYDFLGFKCIVMEYINGKHQNPSAITPELEKQLRSAIKFCRKHGISFTNDSPQGNRLFVNLLSI
ncbi:MAG: hypothetical protein K2X94_01060 [Amoebophilaceae bacterium]|nr:hypothetical protein [Amoebophilaceae bacterium]